MADVGIAPQKQAPAPAVDASIMASALDLSYAMPPLMLEARRVAASFAHGLHGRRRQGLGENFWQFRAFRPGEPAHTIDWRRSARDDTLYVREREWETAHKIWLWVDRSASMPFRSSYALLSKMERALVLTLALADILVERGERVGLWNLLEPRAARHMMERCAEALMLNQDRSGVPMPRALPFREEIILISDFLTPLEKVHAMIKLMAREGARGHLIMVIDPMEQDFPLEGQAILHDPEEGDVLRIGHAASWGEAYRARFKAHYEAVQQRARESGWTFTLHRTDRPASEAALRVLMLISAARVSAGAMS
jgi:uncharacterized protein (DUF58 family)